MTDIQNHQPTGKFDPSTLDYEAWIKFFFDRPVSEINEPELLFSNKYVPQGVTWDLAHPPMIVAHLTRMSQEFKLLGERYTLNQINQAIWAILGPDFEFGNLLRDKTLPLPDRLACLQAMYIPYHDFVCGHPVEVMENCFDMWWDFLGMYYMPKAPDAEDTALRDAQFATLVNILNLPDSRCKAYALHGLGHLAHPQRAKVVQKHMNQYRKTISPDGWKWLEQCRDGTVM